MDGGQLTAEQRARVHIDRQLADAGWSVQSRSELNLFAAQGVAVREVIMAPGHGRADYLLYVDQRAVGAIEAKPEGTTLSGVEWQSATYAEGLPPAVRLKALTTDGRLPFVFEASGSETHVTNGFDPSPRARRIFNVPRPETLARILRDAGADSENPTWRAKVRRLPPLVTQGLRPAQIDAIRGVERSLAEQTWRARSDGAGSRGLPRYPNSYPDEGRHGSPRVPGARLERVRCPPADRGGGGDDGRHLQDQSEER